MKFKLMCCVVLILNMRHTIEFAFLNDPIAWLTFAATLDENIIMSYSK
jgi:hypothetical protein